MHHLYQLKDLVLTHGKQKEETKVRIKESLNLKILHK